MAFIRAIEILRELIEEPESFPFTIAAIRALDQLRLGQPITFFVGDNGSGKSTLLEAIAIAIGLNAEGGSRNLRFTQRQTESELHRYLRVVREPVRERHAFFLRAEAMFNLASAVEDKSLDGYGWELMHQKSHGEALLWLVQHRFTAHG